jgi:Flp pilus assembly pilin Flp
MTRQVLAAFRPLLRDESGQTMLEYVTIVVFVVIVMFIAFRLVNRIVHPILKRASMSIEQ